jgi:hypothetical protein
MYYLCTPYVHKKRPKTQKELMTTLSLTRVL